MNKISNSKLLIALCSLLIVISSCSQQKLFTESKYKLNKVPANSYTNEIANINDCNTNNLTNLTSTESLNKEELNAPAAQTAEETLKTDDPKRIHNSKSKIKNSLTSLLPSPYSLLPANSLKQMPAANRFLRSGEMKKQTRVEKILSKVMSFLDIPQDRLILYILIGAVALLLLIFIGPTLLILLTILLLAVVLLILVRYLL